MPTKATLGSQGRLQAEGEAGLGTHSFIRVQTRMLWGYWDKARLISSNQKEQGYSKLLRGLIQGEALGDRGEYLS